MNTNMLNMNIVTFVLLYNHQHNHCFPWNSLCVLLQFHVSPGQSLELLEGLAGTNFRVLVACCIWQVLILVFFYEF